MKQLAASRVEPSAMNPYKQIQAFAGFRIRFHRIALYQVVLGLRPGVAIE